MTRSFSRRTISIIISIMIVFAFMPILGQDAYAAVKKPGTPKITSAQVNANTVSLKWSKAKNAKKYKVFVQTGADGWKYWKSVKKNKANKKKYSDALKYKLKASGKKYKVYKKKNPYRLIKTTTALKYKYKGKYSTTYRFVVRAVNGKKAGNYSAAKAVKTGAKPKPPADASQPDPGNSGTPTVPAPGKVSNLKAEFKVEGGTNMIYVTWSAASNATSYDVYRKKGTGASATNYPSTPNATKTDCKYSLKDVSNNQTYFFKVIAKNKNGVAGQPVETSITTPAAQAPPTTPTAGGYTNNRTAAWNEYLAAMLTHYKEILHNKNVEINSTNSADEFKKLQAIIQVMHDYVGYSELGTTDYTNYPTGDINWFYNDNTAAVSGSNTNGNYYNGKDYIPTIEFYASCEKIAATQEYLAQKAGLDVFTLVRKDGHVYTMICANNVWYNADPAMYMAPGANGLNYPGWRDPANFKEASYNIGHKLSSGATFDNTYTFKLSQVFYGSNTCVSNTGGLRFENETGGIGINPANATYTSSDESILSFDDTNGTCTFHNTGIVYVTITYQNLISSGQPRSITTTISVKVLD